MMTGMASWRALLGAGVGTAIACLVWLTLLALWPHVNWGIGGLLPIALGGVFALIGQVLGALWDEAVWRKRDIATEESEAAR